MGTKIFLIQQITKQKVLFYRFPFMPKMKGETKEKKKSPLLWENVHAVITDTQKEPVFGLKNLRTIYFDKVAK